MSLISGELICRLYQKNRGVAYIRRTEVSLILRDTEVSTYIKEILRCRLYQENCGVAYNRRTEVSLISGELRCHLYQEN